MSTAFLRGVGQEKVDIALVVHTTLHGAEGHSDLKQMGYLNINVQNRNSLFFQGCGSGRIRSGIALQRSPNIIKKEKGKTLVFSYIFGPRSFTK
jgi:hypothetical protein